LAAEKRTHEKIGQNEKNKSADRRFDKKAKGRARRKTTVFYEDFVRSRRSGRGG